MEKTHGHLQEEDEGERETRQIIETLRGVWRMCVCRTAHEHTFFSSMVLAASVAAYFSAVLRFLRSDSGTRGRL
jgi:dolichol kinase